MLASIHKWQKIFNGFILPRIADIVLYNVYVFVVVVVNLSFHRIIFIIMYWKKQRQMKYNFVKEKCGRADDVNSSDFFMTFKLNNDENEWRELPNLLTNNTYLHNNRIVLSAFLLNFLPFTRFVLNQLNHIVDEW